MPTDLFTRAGVPDDAPRERPALRAHLRTAAPAALIVVAAALAVALDAPAWLRTVLSVIAVLATAARLVRRRRLGWGDAILTGTAGVIIVLMLLGLLLDVLPGGIDRVGWAIVAGLVALAAIALGERTTPAGATALEVDRRAASRLLPAYLGLAGLGAVALIISVHATRLATRAPAALSLVGRHGTSVTVEVSAGHDPARYELVLTSDGSAPRTVGPFAVPGDGHVRRAVQLPPVRSVIALRVVGSGSTGRALVVSPPGSDAS